MKYNVDYFLNFFGKRDNWVSGELHDQEGNHCALGHMRFQDESKADYNVRAKALAKMITNHLELSHDLKLQNGDELPSSLIPTINDGHHLYGTSVKTGKTKNLDTKKVFGKEAKDRIQNVLNEIKAECDRIKAERLEMV